MSDERPLPSAQMANKANPPRFRFFYPFAAVCVAVALLAPPSTQAQTGAPKLRPDQERAIELMLQDVEPAMRAMARQQLAVSFASLNEAQIAMMLARYADNRAGSAEAPAPADDAETEATPEDRAFMRAQFEPLMRKHHAAQVRFDAFVNAKIAAYCPASGVYARFGSGWRYEVGEFMMESALGANNIEARINVAGEAYMPKDGRYQFDFSKVRTTFDEAALDAVIRNACDRVHAVGKAFLAKVDPLIAAKDWDGAFKAEAAANAALEPIRRDLQAAYHRIGPGDIGVFQLAMMNGRKIR